MCTGSSFKCTGYSFRYSISRESLPNCLLTDFTSLAKDSNLLPDRSCDVYFKMSTCLDLERKSDTGSLLFRFPISSSLVLNSPETLLSIFLPECFLKVASNRKLDTTKIVKSVSVRGISDCELACLSSGLFTCRSFGFRHGPSVIGDSRENCFLSDWPISALSIQDYILSEGHEIYERGSFGHGCEVDVGPNIIGPRPPFTGYPLITQTFPEKGSFRHSFKKLDIPFKVV